MVVTTNVLTKEFTRCLSNPLGTLQRQQQHYQGRQCKGMRSGAAAEELLWDMFILRGNEEQEEETASKSLMQRLASVMPREQQQQLVSLLRRRNRQQSTNCTASAGTGADGVNSALCAKSPLLGVHFSRIAVDEGHRLAQSGSLYVQLACALRADKR